MGDYFPTDEALRALGEQATEPKPTPSTDERLLALLERIAIALETLADSELMRNRLANMEREARNESRANNTQ